MASIEFTLTYSGRDADHSQIDFYDVAEALRGFQRSLALTTHLVLNDEVITQAPSLKGAQILSLPPGNGSWKITALIVALSGGAYHLGTAPKDTPLGHMVRSAYDYVVSETLGFHVDYEKTLGQQYEELKRKNPDSHALSRSKLDSVVEKCEPAIKAMHRPIVMSETASEGEISVNMTKDKTFPIGPALTRDTFDYVDYTAREDRPLEEKGRISSYNINTFKGRIFLNSEGRPVPFLLADTARSLRIISIIAQSLRLNAERRRTLEAEIQCTILRSLSRTGRLKSVLILDASRP